MDLKRSNRTAVALAFLERRHMNQCILDFFCNYLLSINIPYYLTTDSHPLLSDFDLGLRNSILKSAAPETSSSLESFHRDSLYHFSDFYNCCYSFFQLPDDRFLFIGPYLLKEITETDVQQLITMLHIPDSLFHQLKDYYCQLSFITDKRVFLGLIRQCFSDICEMEEPSVITFDLQTLENREKYLKKHDFIVPEDPILSMNILEKRYHGEDELLAAITQGNTKKAINLLNQMQTIKFFSRSNDAFRDSKNLTISFNTLLRRAAYTGGVHPFYIDVVSANYARLIENAASLEELYDISNYMIQSYCDLVQKRSTALYSEPIRQILVTIDASISSDLSLKRFANELFLNTSYLSSLFKKETGMTLTEYVNKTRISQAKLLLKSTTLSIQSIAAAVGVPDIHYFTRLFRRETGISPREFRKT